MRSCSLVVGVILGLISGLGLAEKKDAAITLMRDVAKNVDLRSDNAKPFQLDVDFRAQSLVPENGHLTLKWAGKDRWVQVVNLAQFQETRVHKGDRTWSSRTLEFTPLRVAELEGLIGIFASVPEKYLKGSKQKQINGLEASCLTFRPDTKLDTSGTKREVCLDPATSTVLLDEERTDLNDRKKEFFDYKPFRDHRYPTVMKLWENGSLLLTATVVAVTEASFDEHLFDPPAGATSRQVCDNTILPVPIKTPDPAYPPGASRAGIGGTATVSLTVEPDGSVDHIHLLGSVGREIDEAVQEQLRKWRFKPAMCGNQPVPYDAQVKVNFQPN
jgi:TonB family protein